MADRTLVRYWGKADVALGPSAWHPLVFHSLDVAAVAEAYLARHPRLRRQFSVWLRSNESSVVRLLTLLVALHDLGKFAENFQCKRADLFREQFPARAGCGRIGARARHDAVGAQWVASPECSRAIANWLGNDVGLAPFLSLLGVTLAHHGKPASSHGNIDDAMSAEARADASAFLGEAFELFAVRATDINALPSGEAIAIAGWWLAGLAVLADWIGSNTEWFGYIGLDECDGDLADYWQRFARPRAEAALAGAGVLPCAASPWQGIDHLFPHLSGLAPRPAQALCATVPIEAAPQLILLEDATGSGKTEAALILAHRLMHAGLADGLFFGLPTQATADQMYQRIDEAGPRLFEPGAQPSIVLAHGQRAQNPLFRQRWVSSSEASDGSDTASHQLSQWLAQGSKRSLLGQIGVGTLDQAQLAGLRVKHQALRLLGLFGKVLIVDEVHAYDDYMQAVLRHVLEAHAAAGGSAILLSATLPLAARQELFLAFDCGARWLQEEAESSRFGSRQIAVSTRPPASLGYPLFTRLTAGAAECEEIAFDSTVDSERELRIDYRSDIGDIDRLIIEAQRDGRCVCWIRNSVREAIETYHRLQSQLDPERLLLFHSRFALGDRLAIQQQVLRRFDRNSTAEDRRGWVLIATQVVEQSLDVDFDLMVSDLAPIDALLQRQGRLQRHRRDREGNSTHATDARGRPTLTVFGPDRTLEPTAHSIRAFSAATEKIYPAHGRLWLTALALGECVQLPADFRRKVEAVYDPERSAPACFESADAKAHGEAMGATFAATRNVAPWLDGYVARGDWQDDDERIGTRLGASVEAVLAVCSGSGLRPYAVDSGTREGEQWALSATRIPEHWPLGPDSEPADPAVAAAVAALKASLPALRWRLVLPLVEGSLEMRARDGKCHEYRYCPSLGLLDRSSAIPAELAGHEFASGDGPNAANG